ncbi:MAG: outer membrane protein assembly factor BamE [Gammaproteobacteria bacterium]
MINPIRNSMGLLPATVALLCMAAPSAWAGVDASPSLTQRVDRLSQRVQALEATVKRLEKQIQAQHRTTPPVTPGAAPSAAAPTPTPSAPAGTAAPTTQAKSSQSPWIIKSKWQKIRKGMTSEQIHSLLGKPSQQFELSGQRVWYYRYPGVGGGSVIFRNDDTVASWQRPPVGWW